MRFTPTGVGTIHPLILNRCHNTVHPHGRGDNNELIKQHRRADGSPPRAWGQLVLRFGRHHSARFTPTGVGTMYAAFSAAPGATVHPHGRGDNPPQCGLNQMHSGSPPRAWGQ